MSEFNITPALELLPAVDVAGGKAVRLTQGEAGSETNYGDPVDAAQEWIDQGAEWIHLVDLDAAFGRGNNRAVIRRVIKATPRRVNIELSGGIRDDQTLEVHDPFPHPKLTWADHGGRFLAAVENGPLSATQFHPEKSGEAGIRLLKNWLDTL